MKTTFTIMLALFATSLAFAQSEFLKDEKAAHDFTEKMLIDITSGNASAAFDAAKKYWPLEASQIDGLAETTSQQLPMLESSFGKLVGYSFAKSEKLGDFAIAEFWVIKYERSALRFYVIYYNGGEGYQINSLRWDDRWDLLFDITVKGE